MREVQYSNEAVEESQKLKFWSPGNLENERLHFENLHGLTRKCT
jgi:hypothetical protein